MRAFNSPYIAIINKHIKTMNLKVNDRIYYTGDMANHAAFGTVTEVLEATKYSQKSVKILYDTERFEGDNKKTTIPVIMFKEGNGQRFKTLEQYNREKEAREKRLREQYPHLFNKAES